MAGVTRVRKTRNKKVQTSQYKERERAGGDQREDSPRARQPSVPLAIGVPHPERCQCVPCLNQGNPDRVNITPSVTATRVRSNARPYQFDLNLNPYPYGDYVPRDQNAPFGNVPINNAPGPAVQVPHVENAHDENGAGGAAQGAIVPINNAQVRIPSAVDIRDALRNNALRNNAMRDNALINSALRALTYTTSALRSVLPESIILSHHDRRGHARCMTCITRPEPIPFQAPPPNPRRCADIALKDFHKHVIEEDLRTPGLIYLDILEDLHAQGPCRRNCQLRADCVWLRQRTHKTTASQTYVTRDASVQTNFVSASVIDEACQTNMSSDVGIQNGDYFARMKSSKAAGTSTASTQASMEELPQLEKPVSHVIGIQKNVLQNSYLS